MKVGTPKGTRQVTGNIITTTLHKRITGPGSDRREGTLKSGNGVRKSEFWVHRFPNSKTVPLAFLEPFRSVWKENQITDSKFSIFMHPYPSPLAPKVAPEAQMLKMMKNTEISSFLEMILEI